MGKCEHLTDPPVTHMTGVIQPDTANGAGMTVLMLLTQLMDQVNAQAELLKTALSLEEQVVDKWCLVMFNSCEDGHGCTSVS